MSGTAADRTGIGPVAALSTFAVPSPAIPGEVRLGAEPISINEGRESRTLTVVNTGDRPVQVGSHFHFPASNSALAFDREAADGFHLDIPAGTSVRFEPGVQRDVTLVRFAGRRHVPGLQLPQPSTSQPHESDHTTPSGERA
jgi:urease subunit beta